MIGNADRLAIVLAGGGDRVIAWQTGVLAGLADAGLDGREADAILGTSAGAIAAARLAAGADPRVDADLIAAAPPVVIPGPHRRAVSEAVPRLREAAWESGNVHDETERRRRAGKFALPSRGVLSVGAHVARQAARLPKGDWPPSLRLVAVDADTGERVVLDASTGVGLAEGVAAAGAVPGLVEPLNVGGRRFIDGALGSATNCDLLPDGVEFGIVITPTPSWANAGSLDELWNEALEAERSALAVRWIRIIVIHASAAAAAAMGDDLTSAADAPRAVVAGREHGAELGAEILMAVGV